MEYGSKGVAGAGLGLGIAGTALGVLNGGLGNILGGIGGWNNGGCCTENMPVNRYDAAKDARIAALETEVKLRDANTFTMGEMGKLRDYMEGRFSKVEGQLCAQAVHNANNDAVLACIQGQVATLMGLTKTVIPTTSICPEPMLKYNSWTAPTTPAAGA